jgi:hypothetical protein
MSQDGSVFTWDPLNIDQRKVESEEPRMSQDGSVFTWDSRNMDQGGEESEDIECHRMALYSPGTPITWTTGE